MMSYTALHCQDHKFVKEEFGEKRPEKFAMLYVEVTELQIRVFYFLIKYSKTKNIRLLRQSQLKLFLKHKSIFSKLFLEHFL